MMNGSRTSAGVALRSEHEAGRDPGGGAEQEAGDGFLEGDGGVEQQRSVGEPLQLSRPDRAGTADVERSRP